MKNGKILTDAKSDYRKWVKEVSKGHVPDPHSRSLYCICLSVYVCTHDRQKVISSELWPPADSICMRMQRWTCRDTHSLPHGYNCKCLLGSSCRTRPHQPERVHTGRYPHKQSPLVQKVSDELYDKLCISNELVWPKGRLTLSLTLATMMYINRSK